MGMSTVHMISQPPVEDTQRMKQTMETSRMIYPVDKITPHIACECRFMADFSFSSINKLKMRLTEYLLFLWVWNP